MSRNGPSRADWFGMVSAGVLLGGTLSLAVSAWVAQLPLGSSPSVQVQLTMWSVPAVWMSVLSLVFAAGSARRAWAGLLLANLVVGLPALLLS